jgi:hypothetical protein
MKFDNFTIKVKDAIVVAQSLAKKNEQKTLDFLMNFTNR